MKGEKGIVEPTFVYLPGIAGGDAIAKETGVDFFSIPVELGVSRNTQQLFRLPHRKLTLCTARWRGESYQHPWRSH